MKQTMVLVIICIVVLITKYMISGAYYDYTLQLKDLEQEQYSLIDSNRRQIADLENYRSTNYLFSQKEALQLKELTPEKTIIVKSRKATAEF